MELFVTKKDGVKQRAIARVCQQCGKDFLVRVSEIRAADRSGRTDVGRHCSQRCNGLVGTSRSPNILKEGELFLTKPNGTRQRAIWHACPHCATSFLVGLPRIRTAEKAGLSLADITCSPKCGARHRDARKAQAKLIMKP